MDPDQQMDEEMDEELAMALALSLQDHQGGSATSSNPAPQQASHAVQPNQLAATLASFLQQGLQGTPQAPNLAQLAQAFASIMPAQPAANPPPQGQFPQQAAPPRRAPRSAPAPAMQARTSPVPAWAAQLTQWWTILPQSAAGPLSVTLTAAQLPDLLQRMSSVLGRTVVTSPAPGQRDTLLVQVTSSGDGFTLNDSALDATVTTWRLSHVITYQTFQGAFSGARAAAAAAAATAPTVAQALELLKARLAVAAWNLLSNDEDDIYSEGGQQAAGMLSTLKAGGEPGLVEAMVAACSSPADAKVWEGLMRQALARFKGAQLTEAPERQGLITALAALTSTPRLQMCLLKLFLDDLLLHWNKPARALEAGSAITPLLSWTPFVDPLTVLQRQPASPAKELFMQLKGYPNCHNDMDMIRGLLHGTLKTLANALVDQEEKMGLILNRVIPLKDPSGKPLGREVFTSWLAMVASQNYERSKVGERGMSMMNPQSLMQGGSDGVLLNLCSICLRLCRPFVTGYLERSPKFTDLLSKHLSPAYYTTQQHRLRQAVSEPSLAGERGLNASSSAASSFLAASLPDGKNGPTFIADIFFITGWLMHVGLIQATHRFGAMMETLSHMHKEGGEEGSSSARSRGPHPEVMMVSDCCSSALLEPTLAVDAIKFYSLQAIWLHRLLQSGTVEAFSYLPEFMVADIATWMSFVIRMGHADMIASVNIGDLLAALTALLERPDLVRSPLVQNKLVGLLLSMLAPQLQLEKRTGGGGLGRTYLRPGEAALVASILGTSTTQRDLIPALMASYAAADNVVGLDVDKDNFDKFGMRNCIDMILEELYRDERCRACIQQLAAAEIAAPAGPSGSSAAGAGPGRFGAYINSLLNGLIYLFKDSLERLADIQRIEQSKADTATWSALNVSERADKDRFYQSQQHTCRGFMSMATTTLRLLNIFAADPTVVRAFLRQPLGGRCAHAALNFLDLLVGPRCAQLDVSNPRQYHFDRPKLQADVVTFMLRLGQFPEFISMMLAEPDFEHELLERAVEVVRVEQPVLADQLKEFVAVVVAASSPPPAKRPKPSAEDESGEAGEAEAMSVEASFSEPEPADLSATYTAVLEPLAFGVYDTNVDGGYLQTYRNMADQAAGDQQQKMKRLSKEMRDLMGRTRLPCMAEAAIFVRHDEDRMDKVRAVITGPQDTPYEGGCFIFDIFFPPGYPNVPPLMMLNTTGEGRVRFNPNLYADGKVCLSLLGTWHGGHESEKWNPNNSTLYQILMSIQSMIFIEDPYFNEPNVEIMRGTTEGNAASALYNTELRLNTVRWAMVDQLKNPKPGFEDVIRSHFKLLRHRLMRTCQRWAQEATAVEASLQRRLAREVAELHALLAAL